MLTKEEQALAADASVMLAKNRIIQMVYELFGRLAEEYKVQAVVLPAAIIQQHPKISRGENYLGLPWVMLDYPRQFAGGGTFAIRTMFWWGHYFSLHLLLQGSQMQLLQPERLQNTVGWYFSTAADPWQHRYDEHLAIPADKITFTELENQAIQGFYKLSIYMPLQQWNTAEAFLTEKFREIIGLFANK